MPPLTGSTVVVTRTRTQASQLVDALAALGADVLEVPVIVIGPPADGGEALRGAVARADGFDWVVVTSPNGADALVAAAAAADADDAGLAVLRATRLAVVGPATADRLRRHGLEAALVPTRFVAEGLLDAFPDPPSGGGSVLLAQAAGARDVLARGLRARGWHVEVVPAYETVAAEVDAGVRDAVASADIVTFTSSSTVDNFVDALGLDAVPPLVACIGPVTTATARARGLTVDVEAATHTVEGLVAALVAHVESARLADPS